MAKYIVRIEEKLVKEVEIEAKSLKKAKKKAYENYENMEVGYITAFEDLSSSKVTVRPIDDGIE